MKICDIYQIRTSEYKTISGYRFFYDNYRCEKIITGGNPLSLKRHNVFRVLQYLALLGFTKICQTSKVVMLRTKKLRHFKDEIYS